MEEEITFNEFKSFITGLIKGKRGVLPDVNDWKDIKEMMDKVVPDVREVHVPSIPVTNPHPDNVPPSWPTYPSYPQWPTIPQYPNDVWYSNTTTGNAIIMKNHDHTIDEAWYAPAGITRGKITVDDIDSDAFFENGFSQDPAFQITGYAKK